MRGHVALGGAYACRLLSAVFLSFVAGTAVVLAMGGTTAFNIGMQSLVDPKTRRGRTTRSEDASSIRAMPAALQEIRIARFCATG
jgi:hypothetical protein